MELSELSQRVEKLEEIIQELAKWTNFKMSTKEGTTDSSHQNKNGRSGNVSKSARETEDLHSSVVIKMELEEDEDDADAISGQLHEDGNKGRDNENRQASSLQVFKCDPDEDYSPFIPSDGEEAEYSTAESESDLMEPEPPRKRRMSAKRKYEPLKVPPKCSLPSSEPFVSLRPLTPSQILIHLPKTRVRKKTNDLKYTSNTREFKTKTKTASTKHLRQGDTCQSDARLARPFACPHCPYAAAAQKTLSAQILSLHPATEGEVEPEPANPFKCLECPKSFRLKQHLSGHISYVHKNTEGNFRCDSCPYVGKNQIHLQNHFNRRHKKPSYFCYFCPWMGRRSTHLANHMRTHTEEKPFNCPYCIYTSSQYSTMRNHVKNIHNKNEGSSQFQFQYSKSSPMHSAPAQTDRLRRHKRHKVSLYKCVGCDLEGFTRSSLKEHLNEHKIKGDKIFKCHQCPYGATSRKTLSAHNRSIHSKVQEELSDGPVPQNGNPKPLLPFQCPNCPKSFRLKQHLSGHISYVHKNTEGNFLCDSCPYVGKNQIHLQNHFKRRHKTPSYFCYFCPWMGRRSTHLANHMRTHTEEKPFNCPYCIYTSSQYSTMRNHVKNIHKKKEGSSQFQFQYSKSSTFPTQRSPADLKRNDVALSKCKFCDCEGFTYLSLREHLKEHKTKGDRLYKCPHCPYSAKLNKYLSNHIRSMHPKEGEEFHRPFKCAECPKAFRFKDGLSRHTLNLHRNRDRTFLCDSCPYLGRNQSALRNHIKYNHKDPIRTCYFCPWVAKDFASMSNHIRIHTGERPYKCPHCIYTSTRGQTLMDHVKIVHGKEEGEFQCEKCSCKFKNLSWLKRHQQIHNGSAYKCGICEFEAFNDDSLKEHLKGHKTEDGKMFQCPHCPKMFKGRFVIQGHIKTHHTEEGPYNCEKCSYSFTDQSQLITHKSTCKTSRRNEDLKEKEVFSGQAENIAVTATAPQMDNLEDLITMRDGVNSWNLILIEHSLV